MRGFIFGCGAGSLATAGLIVGGVLSSDPWFHRWIFPAIVFGCTVVVTGLFELALAVRRHLRLQRDLATRVDSRARPRVD